MSDSQKPAARPPRTLTTSPTPEPGPDELTQAGSSSSLSSGRRKMLEDLQGRQVGDFQLIRRLGKGGMAEVYLAEQASLKRNVAIKVLRSDLLDADDVLVKRFEQEAKAAGSLNHANIIQVYAIGEDNGLHYIAQEYVQGMNLRELITKRGVPELAVAVHIMRQTAAALEAAAAAGIVHRDIKPENIMITGKGKVKVADFGLAQLTQGGEKVSLTQTGMTMGTPLYMSPEQINGQKVDQRSDVYSLGVTCYHMLTGQPPFRGPTAMSIAVKHLREDATPLQERRPDLPPVLCQIVHRMMTKDPSQRYQSAQAVSTDLKKLAKVIKEQPEAAAEMSLSQATRIVDSTLRPPGWFQRHPVAAFVIAFVLIGGASAGAGWWARPGDPFRTPVTAVAKVAKQGTAAEQYARAKMFGPDDAAAWQAVLEHFPGEIAWTQRARVELAFLHLRDRRWEEAEKAFNDLAANGDDQSIKANALAGKAILASIRGNPDESQRIMADELLPVRQHLDPDVARLVFETIERNRKALGNKIDKRFDELFQGAPGNG